MKLKRCIAALVLVVAINFTPIIVRAQFDGFPDSDPDDTSIPFDGGVSILVAAGIAYGLKKKHHHNKKQAEEEEIQ